MNTNTPGTTLTADPHALGAFWDAMTERGHVYEVRIFKGRRGPAGLQGTVSGYFNDKAAFVREVSPLTGDDAPGVYGTMNPVDPALLARKENSLAEKTIKATSDADIIRRRRFLIDLDAANPADSSATDDERAAALALRDEIRADLRGRGWPDALIVTSSGNGGGLIFEIDLPNDDQTRDLIKRALEALHARFSTAAATVDVSVSNASRLTRIMGTVTAKGAPTAERPWRRATAEYPEGAGVVTRAQLEALAAQAPRTTRPTMARTTADGQATGDAVEVDDYADLLAHGSPVGRRHHDMTRLVGHYLARGLSTPEVQVLGRVWADRCTPPVPYADVDVTIRDLAAAEARKQARASDEDDPGDQGDAPGARPPMSPAAMRDLIATQQATLANYQLQILAWERLFLNRAIPDKAKRVLVHMHKRTTKVPVGRPLPDVMPCDMFADEQDLREAGFAGNAYEEGRDILLSLGLVTRQVKKKVAPPPASGQDGAGATEQSRTRGQDWFYVWALNGAKVNTLWEQLPDLTEIPATERQVKAKQRRDERLEKAIAEEMPTVQVVRALKRDVEQERKQKEQAATECIALEYERNNARDALEEAGRIIQENQRQTATVERIMCRAGCGSFIRPAEWCCDECRERERDAIGDSRLTFNLESDTGHTVGVTNRVDVNLESPARALPPQLPCHGGCGKVTDNGWHCLDCLRRMDRPAAPLHIQNSFATSAGGGAS